VFAKKGSVGNCGATESLHFCVLFKKPETKVRVLCRKDGAERNRFHIVIPPDSDLGDKYLYEVVVFTGVLRTAGTSANVTIVLEGETGHCTGPHVISNERRHLLQPGSIDTFAIAAKEPLGKVVQVHLWHDNSGLLH